jgi:hypothetical protein
MRKFLTFLFALAIALPATAGWLPDALCDGDNGAATPGPFWVQLYLDEFQNGAPFSIPSPVGLVRASARLWHRGVLLFAPRANRRTVLRDSVGR